MWALYRLCSPISHAGALFKKKRATTDAIVSPYRPVKCCGHVSYGSPVGIEILEGSIEATAAFGAWGNASNRQPYVSAAQMKQTAPRGP